MSETSDAHRVLVVDDEPNIVDAHGDRVSAANASGGGASFVVTLPAK